MLTLSTKGRYAARIMVFLTTRLGSGPVTKFRIAEAEELSPDYIEQIMVRLKAAGLVNSHRGRKGGFSIGRDPHEMTMADIIVAIEGPIRPVPCIDKTCKREAICPTRGVWLKAVAVLENLFGRTTVAQMADQVASHNAITYNI